MRCSLDDHTLLQMIVVTQPGACGLGVGGVNVVQLSGLRTRS